MWRIGMLGGTGTGRKRILPALRDSQTCQVTVVEGRSHSRLAEIRNGDSTVRLVSGTAEFEQLADLFDVVYIGSPPFLRTRHVAIATRLGKPILCEKPLATNRQQAMEVAELVRAAGVPFMLAHQVRHQSAVADIKAAVDAGTWGSVRGAHLQWTFRMDRQAPNAVWKARPELAGSSSMFDSGVHAVDLATYWFGAPRAVYATGGASLGEAVVLETVTAVLEYDGFAATVLTSQDAVSHDNGVSITFANAAVRAPGLLGEQPARMIELISGLGHERREYPAGNLYRAEVEDFCASNGGGWTNGATLADAEVTTEVLFAIEDAVASGRRTLVGQASVGSTGSDSGAVDP